ncbi:hypothetical protein MP228_012988 [Amoeboaphelidium protococcarum]|nr:hypothetical protein MP228_012988 [Amoeboaphelidium protococcarum]
MMDENLLNQLGYKLLLDESYYRTTVQRGNQLELQNAIDALIHLLDLSLEPQKFIELDNLVQSLSARQKLLCGRIFELYQCLQVKADVIRLYCQSTSFWLVFANQLQSTGDDDNQTELDYQGELKWPQAQTVIVYHLLRLSNQRVSPESQDSSFQWLLKALVIISKSDSLLLIQTVWEILIQYCERTRNLDALRSLYESFWTQFPIGNTDSVMDEGPGHFDHIRLKFITALKSICMVLSQEDDNNTEIRPRRLYQQIINCIEQKQRDEVFIQFVDCLLYCPDKCRSQVKTDLQLIVDIQSINTERPFDFNKDVEQSLLFADLLTQAMLGDSVRFLVMLPLQLIKLDALDKFRRKLMKLLQAKLVQDVSVLNCIRQIYAVFSYLLGQSYDDQITQLWWLDNAPSNKNKILFTLLRAYLICIIQQDHQFLDINHLEKILTQVDDITTEQQQQANLMVALCKYMNGNVPKEWDLNQLIPAFYKIQDMQKSDGMDDGSEPRQSFWTKLSEQTLLVHVFNNPDIDHVNNVDDDGDDNDYFNILSANVRQIAESLSKLARNVEVEEGEDEDMQLQSMKSDTDLSDGLDACLSLDGDQFSELLNLLTSTQLQNILRQLDTLYPVDILGQVDAVSMNGGGDFQPDGSVKQSASLLIYHVLLVLIQRMKLDIKCTWTVEQEAELSLLYSQLSKVCLHRGMDREALHLSHAALLLLLQQDTSSIRSAELFCLNLEVLFYCFYQWKEYLLCVIVIQHLKNHWGLELQNKVDQRFTERLLILAVNEKKVSQIVVKFLHDQNALKFLWYHFPYLSNGLHGNVRCVSPGDLVLFLKSEVFDLFIS